MNEAEFWNIISNSNLESNRSRTEQLIYIIDQLEVRTTSQDAQKKKVGENAP